MRIRLENPVHQSPAPAMQPGLPTSTTQPRNQVTRSHAGSAEDDSPGSEPEGAAGLGTSQGVPFRRPVALPAQGLFHSRLFTSFCERLVSSVLDSAEQFSAIQTETKPQ